MKKKLLLHVGYPKTATTTLQEQVFLTLHKQGRINYLGRTITSTHTRTGKSEFKGEDWAVKLRKHLVLGEPFDVNLNKLKSDRLNVLSDEDLTFHPLFNSLRFGVQTDPFDFSRVLNDFFGEEIDLSLLVTVRNQPDLIHSCYVQKYRVGSSHNPSLTFSEFLYQGKNSLDVKHLAVFDFNQLLNSYKKYFDAPAQVLLFEDFLHDRFSFCEKLANLLPVSAEELMDLMAEKHFRKRKKDKDGIVLSVSTPSRVGKVLSLMMGEQTYEAWKEKRYYMRNSRRLQVEKNILFEKHTVIVPFLSDEERSAIKDLFASANEVFARQHQIDLKKMNEYGYF